MRKPILCLDFDGVLHSYASGWQGADVIPDPPVPGALDFVRRATQTFDVHVYSARSAQPGGVGAMRAWLVHWAEREWPGGTDLAFLDLIAWPAAKPNAHVTLDDRAVTFTGEWPSLEALLAFRPWHKSAPR